MESGKPPGRSVKVKVEKGDLGSDFTDLIDGRSMDLKHKNDQPGSFYYSHRLKRNTKRYVLIAPLETIFGLGRDHCSVFLEVHQ